MRYSFRYWSLMSTGTCIRVPVLVPFGVSSNEHQFGSRQHSNAREVLSRVRPRPNNHFQGAVGIDRLIWLGRVC